MDKHSALAIPVEMEIFESFSGVTGGYVFTLMAKEKLVPLHKFELHYRQTNTKEIREVVNSRQ